MKNSTAGGFSSSCWDVSLAPSHDSHERFSGVLRAECKQSPKSTSRYGTCSKLWLGNCYANIDGKIVPEPMYRLESEHPSFLESCKHCTLSGTFLTCSCKVGGFFAKEKTYGETTVNLDDLIHNDGGYLGCYDKRGDERSCPPNRKGKQITTEAGKHTSSKATPTTKVTTTTTVKPDHAGEKNTISTSFVTSTVTKMYTATGY
ncbi:hypothetical protein DL769_007600 [Monosporascus sp. CRB-8-3]|nr:hypothetical protein DL769_007600 [Monosporascus sp. CRB-8-3]